MKGVKMENKKSNNGLVVMILGIIAASLSYLFIGLVPAIISIVLGVKSLKKNGANKFVFIGMGCSGFAIIVVIIMSIVIAAIGPNDNSNLSNPSQSIETSAEEQTTEVTETLKEENQDTYMMVETETEEPSTKNEAWTEISTTETSIEQNTTDEQTEEPVVVPSTIEPTTEMPPIETQPATTTQPPTDVPIITEAPTRKVEYIGNAKTMKFHDRWCSWLPDEENRVYFDSAEDAENAGYVACKKCYAN